MRGDGYRLRVPADAAFGVTVRAFAASAARTFPGVQDGAIEDLRLVASELLANSAEGDGGTLELELAPGTDGAAWQLTALGAGDLEIPIPLGASKIRRIDVLRGIAEVRIDGGRVVCSDAGTSS